MSDWEISDSVPAIAIVGMRGRFPGAPNLDVFWQNLRDGVESISFFSDEELLSSGLDPAVLSQPNYVRARAILADAEWLDAAFFGYTPREAEITDPQQRLLLECAWEVLEDAGYDAEKYAGSIGVFAGVGMNSYLLRLASNPDLIAAMGEHQVLIGNDKDFLTTRISYKLNLTGPSITVQTACSTSLVAVCLACQSLLNYQCDMALAGGVSVHFPQKTGYFYHEGGIFSPDGHCRAFDAQAQGTVSGNGVGLVVLRRLEDALADGDQIHALIKGFAINNDGSLKVGYTAPNVRSQAEVIATAQAVARVPAETITYVETHGTGTPLGDPIEIAALTQAFRISTGKKGFCAIGSLKTNVGHLDAAAGVASLIKTVLALKHGMLPPSLHFEQPNLEIDFADSPFYVNAELSAWKAGNTPRRAGVSSFGMGGTNAHVVLEEAPVVEASSESRPRQLLVLSAKTNTALETATANLVKHLKQHPALKLADVAYTLQAGRRTFSHRRMLVCQNLADAVSALEVLDPRRVLTDFQESRERPVTFMFSGQGSQYVNMALELYEVELTFREWVDRCSEFLQSHLGFDLRTVLYPREEQIEEATQQLKQTAVTQPALFVIEYALARLWMEWGVRPRAMIGHSIGEYVAACLAGVFSLEDALALVAARGRLMQELPTGAMLTVRLSKEALQPLLGEHLSLAAINEPRRCVVSGPTDVVDGLERQLSQQDVACRRLHTSHAFHSEMMEPILEPFTERVRRANPKPPRIPYVSNVTGTWITPAGATDPSYWARHLRQTVRFSDGVRELMQEPARVLLEIGPGRTLSTLARKHLEKGAEQVVLSSLRHPRDEHSDVAFLLSTLGRLWLAGVQVDWSGFYSHERRHRLSLPTYPFERQRYWIELPKSIHAVQPRQTPLAKKTDIANWFYIPSWKRSMPPIPFEPGGLADQKLCWLVFADECGLGSGMVERLEQAGQDVISVMAGDEFTKLSARAYAINPRRRDDYDTLFATLSELDRMPTTIVHLWNVSPNGHPPPGTEFPDRSQYLGFYSLLFLAQALGQQNITDSIQIGIISSNVRKVTGEDALCPEKATILGPCKVIPQEYPNITCRSIDIVLPESDTLQMERSVDQLIAELATESPDTVVAYRDYDRWVQTFEPVHLDGSDEGAKGLLRERGVYLITGGLGGVGLELAKYLAQAVRAKLVLTGRSAFPAREQWEEWLASHDEEDDVSHKIRKLKALENLGAEVFATSADVTDERQVQEVISRTHKRFGEVHGVIHAAGVAGGGVIQLKTPEVAADVLAPKVKGTQVLANALKDMPLDFFVLCSSLISISGGFGRVDYCAANAFLDAFAQYNTSKHGTFTVSINWDTWQGVGMAVDTVLPRRLQQFQPIPHYEGIAHPLLDRRIRETPDREVYLTEFSVAEHWVLSEHRIMGRATVPGTAYLEMVRAAFENHAKSGAVEIREVFFLAPLMVRDDEKKKVRTILEKDGDGFSFRIVTKPELQTNDEGPGWQEHARGKVRLLGTKSPRRYDLENMVKRCNARDIAFAEKEHEHVHLGPRWRSLKRLYVGADEVVTILELPQEFSADLEEFGLHPALLDEAMIAGQLFAEGIYLPLSYKAIKIKGPLPRRVYSYARYKESDRSGKETIVVDITLMDEHGVELVEIEEFTLKRAADDATAELRRLAGEKLYSPGEESQHAVIGYATGGERATDLGETMLPEEGIDAFRRILCKNRLPQVVVSTRDLQAWVAWVNTLTKSRLLEEPDKVRLPTTAHPRPLLQTSYVAPRNEIEQSLAQIWQEVLGIEQVGIHDNFFELGGDSLLGIQILARAEQAGLRLAPQELFQHQTISELTVVVGAAPAIQAEQSIATGPVPLTPIQRWFFEQDVPDPHYWNQAILLEVQQDLSPSLLEQAVEELLLHHDALRLRFAQEESGWQQVNAGPDEAIPFEQVDLSAVPEAKQGLAIEARAAELQASLNLSEGPLMRVAFFDLGAHKPDRLLIVIHHLAVDVRSWRVLLEDLQTVYKQLSRGEAIQLPPKTTSFKRWAERLTEYARSGVLQQELDYWLATCRAQVARLPVDYPQGKGANTEASTRTVSVSLSAEETQALLQEVPKAYRTRTDEVLLTALMQAFARWTGVCSLLIDLESDGREMAFEFEDVDLSRTVGWFTTLHPMLLHVEEASDPGAALKSVKEQLRSIPNRGMGYGLLRYLSGDGEIIEKLQALPQAEVSFLYLGQLDRTLPDSLLGQARESSGPDHGPRGSRSHLLAVEGIIVRGRLRLDWRYSEHVHLRTTIEALAQDFMAALRSLITHCQSPEAGGYTPSDFPEAELSQEDLDELIAEFGEVVEED